MGKQKKSLAPSDVINVSPVHHHMNLLYQQMSLYLNSKSILNNPFTALLCLTASQNLRTLGRKCQTRLSFTIRRQLCTKCLIPLQLSGRVRVRKRRTHIYCSLCNHRLITSQPGNKWHSCYSESMLPDSYCNEN
ncbi:ribonuclease P subunit RPR2 [Schistosoma japonicum]|uniref:Ribonuclease P subunit RPR2 n=1 Tax=Schistosoma japonicum TaxID=6182 RepID=A0A4Z2CS91_SCHJA|nr:ribonuclease P subunit RPR2 [Schistosoma japonicum]TNN06954.1 ribonuclease P subunit RPR2 [Schistosoma japonicum]